MWSLGADRIKRIWALWSLGHDTLLVYAKKVILGIVANQICNNSQCFKSLVLPLRVETHSISPRHLMFLFDHIITVDFDDILTLHADVH